MTAAAYRWFAEVAVDVAVVEVGMLGRYDATNVADGAVAVVTNVGPDHTDFREGWRQAVAEEKAGIVKPDSVLVLGETDPALRGAFVAEAPSEVWTREEEFGCDENALAVGGRLLDLRTPNGTVEGVFLPLHGAHQGDNAACALAAAEALFGRPLAVDVVRDAVRRRDRCPAGSRSSGATRSSCSTAPTTPPARRRRRRPSPTTSSSRASASSSSACWRPATSESVLEALDAAIGAPRRRLHAGVAAGGPGGRGGVGGRTARRRRRGRARRRAGRRPGASAGGGGRRRARHRQPLHRRRREDVAWASGRFARS